ncbi:DNA replication protein DnaC [Clostridiales bacterium CHKCI006]|nr:DNA replication protein DnaC [Clostridiales bacterium CHKCI006]
MHKKMREIAELKAKGVSNRGVAEKTGYARNTVNKIVKQINEAGLTYDEVRNLSDQILSKHFNDPVSSRRNQDFFLPNFELLTKELAKPGVTRQLLWEEYMTECRMQKKKGYQLTQFKKHFNDHLNVHQFKDILKRKAGESIEVDWAGQRLHWNDPDTGATVYGYLFVASLSFSGYSFAYVTKDMKTVLEQISDDQYILNHRNIVLMGACGVGKSFVANALAAKACEHLHKTLYVRMFELLEECNLERLELNDSNQAIRNMQSLKC